MGNRDGLNRTFLWGGLRDLILRQSVKSAVDDSESHPVYPVHPCEVGFQIL